MNHRILSAATSIGYDFDSLKSYFTEWIISQEKPASPAFRLTAPVDGVPTKFEVMNMCMFDYIDACHDLGLSNVEILAFTDSRKCYIIDGRIPRTKLNPNQQEEK